MFSQQNSHFVSEMEVFQTEKYYIFVKKENSLWWNRTTSEFTIKAGIVHKNNSVHIPQSKFLSHAHNGGRTFIILRRKYTFLFNF